MYSNCAEQILRVYELDANQSVAGVCATLACDTESDSSTSKIDALSPNIRQRLLDKFQRFWDQEQLFIPYDGKYHRKVAPHIPDSVAAPVGLFHGCRMTFRLKVLREVGGFEELLLRSAYCEDGDCSYRVSRKGTLLVARNAQIFHEQTTQERTKRRLNTLMILMNAIVLFELNKSPELRSNVVIYSFLAKRAALEFLRDSFKLRLQFPNLSAVFEAFTLTPKLIKLRSESLRDEYLKTQERLFAK
jgi:GT2 family glycosyltransferase